MTSKTADALLAHLKALSSSKEAPALDTAGEHISGYLAGLIGEPSEKAESLASLQARFQRETAPSPARSEILDLLSDHVVRLLEAN